jgi:hypothetical protein
MTRRCWPLEDNEDKDSKRVAAAKQPFESGSLRSRVWTQSMTHFGFSLVPFPLPVRSPFRYLEATRPVSLPLL